MRLGLRLGQSMHVGSFSPGRSGEKLGNSESQVLMRCICKMCTLYVHMAYYYLKTQQAKGNVEMTDEQRNVYVYI